MKVILTAFQGKLRSEPMDWPEGTHGTIRMRMDMPRMDWATAQALDPSALMTDHLCIFEETGYTYPVPGDPRGAREFRLVGFR